jgi:hypothetical protein
MKVFILEASKPVAQLFHILSSHIYREGNAYADKMASHDHVITNVVW